MSAITQITLQDGQTTPANIVFIPVNPQQGNTPAAWRSENGTTTATDRKLSLRTLAKANKYEVEVRISDPVAAAIPSNCCDATNIPVVAYTDIGSVSLSFSKDSTKQQRLDLLAMLSSMLESSPVEDAVSKLEIVW